MTSLPILCVVIYSRPLGSNGVISQPVLFRADLFALHRDLVMDFSQFAYLFPEDLLLLEEISTRLTTGLSCYPGQTAWTVDMSIRSGDWLWAQLQRLLRLRSQLVVLQFPLMVATNLLTWVLTELVFRGDPRVSVMLDPRGAITELRFHEP